MSEPIGALCIVLHGHLPYVLHHGTHPHGEAWLYEAAAETYLPLLDMVGSAALHQARPGLTIGLTPILLEQLAHPRFKAGFVAYLNERIERALSDARHFEKIGQAHLKKLAEGWSKWFTEKQEHFARIGQDIPKEFADRVREGHIQILTSNATHAYMPLLLEDRSIRGQLRAGIATTQRRLGVKPTGLWLPECAYRPTWDHWVPSVLYKDARKRLGLEHFISDAGLTHFFVDTSLITGAHPLGTYHDGRFEPIVESQLYWDTKRGWRDPLQPVGVVSEPGVPKCFALGRHPQASEQVWSGVIGYPGSGEYLEFHRKHEDRGLRYWRVTSQQTDLGAKDVYRPEAVPSKLYEHAQHFCTVIRQLLKQFHSYTGRPGICIAPFDAELFGHWWFEGPQFLRDVILTLANDPSIKLMTAEEALRTFPPDKVLRMPEGSWGEKGNHSVWINDRNRWIWEIEYRAENRFLHLLEKLPWRDNEMVKQMLIRAARELLLLQASDWPFVIHTRGADDYGATRFAGHASRFERALNIAEHVAQGGTIDAVQKTELDEMDAHDSVFPEIDLEWWL